MTERPSADGDGAFVCLRAAARLASDPSYSVRVLLADTSGLLNILAGQAAEEAGVDAEPMMATDSLVVHFVARHTDRFAAGCSGLRRLASAQPTVQVITGAERLLPDSCKPPVPGTSRSAVRMESTSKPTEAC